jgi:NitT/TauT family transport system substrate-binding protein
LKRILFLLIITLGFTSCSFERYERLKISATTWIGYTPLFYAKEKGWLDEINIKLTNVVSLSENMYLFKSGNFDAYVGTQYEYELLLQKNKGLTPVIMFDRSFGGDVIMANCSLEELVNTQESIDAYLEMDSINSTLLKDFIQLHGLEEKKIHYKNNDQAYIASLQAKKMKQKTIIVTYSPYNYQLKEHGFKEIASTKNGLDLLVVDALFTTKDALEKHKEQFIALNVLVQKSLSALQNDPQEFYETVKLYLPETSYEDFLESLDDIIWLEGKLPPALKERLEKANFSTKELL